MSVTYDISNLLSIFSFQHHISKFLNTNSHIVWIKSAAETFVQSASQLQNFTFKILTKTYFMVICYALFQRIFSLVQNLTIRTSLAPRLKLFSIKGPKGPYVPARRKSPIGSFSFSKIKLLLATPIVTV